MKNYLITGGCGFIGQHLIKKLLKPNVCIDVIDLTKKNKNLLKSKSINYFLGDVSEKKVFDRFKKKYLIAFHLAGQTSSRLSELDYTNDINTNIIGSNNFCNWAKRNKPSRVVFTSSMSVYGRVANKIKEKDNLNPSSIYGMSKLYSEKIFERLNNDKIKVTILRLFNIYGPGQDLKNLNQGMFSIYLAQALKSNKINVTGSLQRYRDFVYIDDTIKAMLINPKNKKNWIMNVGTGKKTKVSEVISLIKYYLKNKKIKILQNKSFFEDTWGSYADNLILKSEGWKVETTIHKGAELTVNSAINDKKKN